MEQDPFLHSMAISGLMNIVVVLICIGLSWWGLQQIRLDLFLKNPKSGQAKLLLILVSLALGYGVASFLIAYFSWSGLLKGMI